MDFPYLTRVVKLNVAALAWLASAPPPPEPTAEGAVSTDTTVRFKAVPGAARYIVRWRRTDSNQWPFPVQLQAVLPESAAPANGCFTAGGTCEVVLKGV